MFGFVIAVNTSRSYSVDKPVGLFAFIVGCERIKGINGEKNSSVLFNWLINIPRVQKLIALFCNFLIGSLSATFLCSAIGKNICLFGWWLESIRLRWIVLSWLKLVDRSDRWKKSFGQSLAKMLIWKSKHSFLFEFYFIHSVCFAVFW